jgi:hypothetical protein
MPLKNLPLPAVDTAVPDDVRAFLREADRRIERFQRTSRSHGFIPGDYASTYGMLQALAATNLAPGSRFCEWGSGFGVIACLAALLDFEACGIEIEPELVDAARQLAADFDLPVQFACDSFIPEGGEAYVDAGGEYAWLTTDAGRAAEELDLAPDDFDVIYVYPWPDEVQLVGNLFQRYAAVGAVFVTYDGIEGFRLRRKMAKKQGSGRRG